MKVFREDDLNHIGLMMHYKRSLHLSSISQIKESRLRGHRDMSFHKLRDPKQRRRSKVDWVQIKYESYRE